MRPRLSPAFALALALVAGCGRCGRPAVAPPERWLPANARMAVVVPRLGEAATDLGRLLRGALAVPAAAGAAESWASLRAQLGFDPLDPAALREAGLDPERGAGLALSGAGLLVLPVSDLARLDATVTRLARDRLGAGVRDQGREGGADLVRFRRAAGQPAALSYAAVPGAVLLSTDAAAVAGAALLAESATLAGSASFAAARAALGDGLAALAFAPPGPELAREIPPARDGAALALRGGPGGLQLRAVLLLPAERAEVWNEVAGGDGAALAGADELAGLPPDLFAAGRFGGDPAALGRRISYALPPDTAARLSRARVDLVRDLFAHLSPGAAAGLSLAPTFDATAVAGGLGSAARDPFRLVHLSAVLRVKDPPQLRSGLERLARSAPAMGIRVSARRARGGQIAWVLPVGGGELAWALDGTRLLLAGGAGRLEALRAGAGGWQAPTASSRAALTAGGAGLVLDVTALVRSLRALPPEAFGTGPDGFVVRALADRFLEPASSLAAISISLRVLPGAARLELELEAAAP